jgi:hypothetical protein
VVCDVSKLHFFFKDGKYSRSINLTGMFSVRGFLDENRVILIKSEDEPKKSVEHLTLYDITAKKYTPILDININKPLSAASGGVVVMIKDSNFTPILVVTVSGQSILYGKNDDYAIHKIDWKGKPMLSFSIEGREPKKFPETSKRKRFEDIKLNGQPMPKEMVDQMIKGMPDQYTLFNGLRLDETGLIYVYLPDLSNKTGQEMDIFSAEGKYLYHALLTLPNGLKTVSTLSIKGNFLYVFAEDEEGEGKLLKFKITKPGV